MTAAVMSDLDWQRWAACSGMNREAFFPELSVLLKPEVTEACKRCSVREACLNYAISHDEQYGVWGGLTEEQRKKISTTRSRVRCPDCRSDRVYEDGHIEICIDCGLSWPI